MFCPAVAAECRKCGTVGHYAKSRMCNSTRGANNSYAGKQVRAVNDDSSESESDNNDDNTIDVVSKVAKTSYNSGTIYASMLINDNPVKFLLDGGATCNILNERFVPNSTVLKKANDLRLYNGSRMPVKGRGIVKVINPVNNCQYNVLFYIVENNYDCVLGINALQRMDLMQVKHHNIASVDSSTDTSNPDLEELLEKYSDVFGPDLGKIKGVQVKIRLKDDSTPSFSRSRSVPFALQPAVEEALNKAVASGSLEKVNSSDWASPTVNVPKKDGNVRICSDFKRSVNPQILVDQHPFPTVEELFAKLNGGKVFTKLDLSRCFEQLELHPSSRDILTINTHKGLYRHCRLPYGLACAPAICQKTMEKLLSSIDGRILIYMDDILIAAEDEKTLIELTAAVLSALQKHHVRLNKEKCEFMKKKVVYLGHVISANGIEADNDKVQSVVSAQVPSNVSELRSFLGLVNYYGRFCRNLSTVAKPLNDLTSKKSVWNWTEECQSSFNQIKSLLVNSPVLSYYDNQKELLLHCDASPVGLGCVLAHRDDNGTEHPIAFANRSLTTSERGYAQIDREALSIVYGIEKFRQYVYGRQFTIITDHKPLLHIFGPKQALPVLAAARLQRWAVKLSSFEYNIEFKPGSEHGNADALSRMSTASVPDYNDSSSEFFVRQIKCLPVGGDDVKSETQGDAILKKVIAFVHNGWNEHCTDSTLLPYFKKRYEFAIQDGVLLWGRRVVIPLSLKARVLEELHSNHPGCVRMKMLARLHCWWPNIDKDIEELVQDCDLCQDSRHHPPREAILPWAWPEMPWERIHIDYSPKFNGKALLILVDAHSKWPEVAVTGINDTDTAKTVKILKHWFSRYGNPKVIVSDNGPQFSSNEFSHFVKSIGARHVPSPPYHPSSNGEAERAVQTVKNGLSRLLKEQRSNDLEGLIDELLLSYRSTPHTATRVTPAELFLLRPVRVQLSCLSEVKKRMSTKDVVYPHSKYAEGDSVRFRDYRRNANKWSKGIIEEVKGSRNVTVKDTDGVSHHRHQDQLINHRPSRSKKKPKYYGYDVANDAKKDK